MFNRQGELLGALTRGASAFALRPGLGGRLIAAPFRILPQIAARDRGIVRQLFTVHNIGRRRERFGSAPKPTHATQV